MCRVLSVSSSGFYEWRYRPLSFRAQKNEKLSLKIKTIFGKEKSRAGAIRISKRLKMEGIHVGRLFQRKDRMKNG